MKRRGFFVLITLVAVAVAGVALALWGGLATGEPDGARAIDMTQMPLYVEGEGGARPAIELLALQSIFEPAREGFTLMPLEFGAFGVDVNSAFMLTGPYDIEQPAISIDGQPLPIVTRQSDGMYLVTPALALAHNRLFVFRLARQGHEDITWTFQTATRFQIMSTLPGNQSTNVPVNTGIEVTFTAAGYNDIREHFLMEPAVEGRFIQRGATVIFMPTDPLAAGQLYTVTITAGIGLPGTNEKITEDFVFSFETEPHPAAHRQHNYTVHFSTIYTEYPSFEPPRVSFHLSYPWQGRRPVVEIEVFRFDDDEMALEAVQSLLAIPRWAWVTWLDNRIDTSGLAQMAAFTITEPQHADEWRWFETMQLPDALAPGFYIINASIDGRLNDQMVLQITDLAVQIFADDYKTLLWINDMTTGRPAAAARVQSALHTAYADEQGIAILDAGLAYDDKLVVTAADGKRNVIFNARHVFRDHWGWWGSQASEDYWTVLQLDRTLFQRSDTLHFWGFVQNRSQNEQIDYLTAVVTQGWNWWGGDRDTLHRQVVAVQRGSYSGGMALPHLDPGSYMLTIYHGDVVLNTIWFEVQDFVKPPYQLHATTDRRAAFLGESVTFTVRAEFFEGTPVPDLQLSYGMWGWQLRHDSWGQNAVTDIDGNAHITIDRLMAEDEAQGVRHLSFSAEATLPEIGWVHRWAEMQVFINDIDVSARATRDGNEANLTIDVHTITLDRINDGTAEFWGDFLDAPVEGQVLDVEIIRVYWVPVRIGEWYCFFDRVVVPRYRHERREVVVTNFTITTDTEGHVSHDFVLPEFEKNSFFANITTTDGNGRNIEHSVFIGRDWWSFFASAESGEPFLYGGLPWGEGYDVGDEVNLTVMLGTEQLTRGNFLFVIANGGIVDFVVGQNPLVFNFGEEHLPNATVYAVHFNGHTYHTGWNMRETLRFNSASRELVLDVTTDRDYYRPGDVVNITVRATDQDGNPKAAHVNLAAVDEALFALRDYSPNTLLSLFSHVSSGVRHNFATHRTFESDGIEDEGLRQTAAGDWGGGNDAEADMAPTAAPPAAAEAAYAAPRGAAADTIREIFEDTAMFVALQTNQQGEATFTFRLPHNITAWRLTASGVTNDLYAGNDVSALIVTQPMFVHYTLNSVFLVGDAPSIGVNAFGTALAGGESVLFEVWDYANPAQVFSATGSAFERVNIPLWQMNQAGAHSIIVRATAANGMTDALRHNFTVVESHRTIETATFYEVTADTVIDPGGPGLTQITFTDMGRSRFLNDLLSMRWVRGARIEGLVMQREANRLLNRYFPDLALYMPENDFDPRDYQMPSGGIAMLPHASGDLAVTVQMMPFIMDEISTFMLRNFLWDAFESDGENRTMALYGLAMLHEPVLLYLHAFAEVQGLAIRDVAYVALGFAALGEWHMARALYNERILPHILPIAPYYRIEDGANRHEILEATAVTALLAAQINAPERFGLHQYTRHHHHWDLLTNIQRLSFIIHEIENLSDQPASITYTLFGEEFTQDLSRGRSFTLRIPAQNFHEFNLLEVAGEVGAVSINRVPLEEIDIADAEIVVTRQFFRAGETTPQTVFNQGDLVRVQITVDYSRRALTGTYKITDFLPAGLVHVADSARFCHSVETPGQRRWVTGEGQRVTFFDHNSRFNQTRIYYYYARVINPGTFQAQGTIVQHIGARDYLTVGADGVIEILN